MDKDKIFKVRNFYGMIEVPSEDEKLPILLEYGEINGLNPFEKELTFDQIKYINLRSDVFKTGRLEFLEKDEAELFKELDIYDMDMLFRARDIVDTIENPTLEKLERVIKIKDLNIIDLFRSLAVSIRNIDSQDISMNVLKVVNSRRDEIYKDAEAPTKIKIRQTESELKRQRELEEHEARETELIDENKKLKAEIAKLKKANKSKDKEDTAKESGSETNADSDKKEE